MKVYHRIFSFFLIFDLIFLVKIETAYSTSYIRSEVRFDSSHRHREVYFAPISKADPLSVCPLETLPADLGIAVKQLVTKVSDSVSKIKSSLSLGCSSLQQQMQSNQASIATAIQNQFISGSISASNPTQQQINAQTQQAAAVNQIILTASNMMQRQCIASIDDFLVIQRLIAQIATITGLLVGGWQGIAVAAGGQILGNIPFFTSNVDEAVELFQKYDEINERGSFLCLYRQMQKTSCLLFSRPEDLTINGLDMTFKFGPTRITKDSIVEIEKYYPNLLQNITLFSNISETSRHFIDLMEAPNPAENGSLKTYQALIEWCEKQNMSIFSDGFDYPQAVLASVQALQTTCQELNGFRYREVAGSEDKMHLALLDSYWNFSTLSNYYQRIRGKSDTIISKIANTWESKKYFDSFKNSVDQYRDPISGNQKRMNYFTLVKRLGNTLAQDTFKQIMKTNYDILRETYYPAITKYIRLPFMKPVLSNRVRQRALISMIDLCQTMDPTLVCLYVDTAVNHSFHQAWKNGCVGPHSSLCQGVSGEDELKTLIENSGYLTYFNSLCAVGS